MKNPCNTSLLRKSYRTPKQVLRKMITLREPKSGKESELAYMPENVSKKLAEYIKDQALPMDGHPAWEIGLFGTTSGYIELSGVHQRRVKYPYS